MGGACSAPYEEDACSGWCSVGLRAARDSRVPPLLLHADATAVEDPEEFVSKSPRVDVDRRPLNERTTAERTEEELERCFEEYIQSKTVNGRFCPTPDLAPLPHDDEEEEDEDEL